MMETRYDGESHVAECRGIRWHLILRRGIGVAALLLAIGLGAVMADTPTATSPAAPPPALTVKDDRISANVVQMPLRKVLSQLAYQAKLSFLIAPSDAKRKVTANFKDLPMLEGMQLLLKGLSFAIVTEPTVGADGQPSGTRVTQVRILSKGEAYTTITGDIEGRLARLKRDVAKGLNVDDRRAALKAFWGQRDHMTLEEMAAVIVPAMEDQAPEVRYDALDLVHHVVHWQEGLVDHVAKMAQNDSHPKLRSRALWYLLAIDENSAEGYLEQALKDPDVTVREEAARLLVRLGQYRAEDEEAARKAAKAQETGKNATPTQTSPAPQQQ